MATEWENRKLVRECIYTVLHSVGLGIIILFSFMFVFVFLLVFVGVLFLFGQNLKDLATFITPLQFL